MFWMWRVIAGGAAFLGASLAFELLYLDKFDRQIMARICTCDDRLRRRLRSAMITFSLNVFPGGSPFTVHALDVDDEAAEIARIKKRYEARLQRVFA